MAGAAFGLVGGDREAQALHAGVRGQGCECGLARGWSTDGQARKLVKGMRGGGCVEGG